MSRLVAHVRAAARAAERAEAVRAIREPRDLCHRRIDEVIRAHIDNIALRRARLDRRLRVGVDRDRRRARAAGAAGAACGHCFCREDEVVVFFRHGPIELCRDADEDIDVLLDGRACDIQRIAAAAARRAGRTCNIAAIDRPKDRAASEIDDVVCGRRRHRP